MTRLERRRAPVGLDAGRRPTGAPSTGIPLPPALAAELASGPFVGRADALARLRARYERAASGARQFVLLAGEPGIGKTRLATELARDAHAAGATVLYGRSDAESLVPYQPFITAIQHYIAHREHARAAGRARAGADASSPASSPRCAATCRSCASRSPRTAETRRYRLFEAVTRVLAFVARERPMVLILDDLQWADTSTALLLAHLLQDAEPMRLLVLGDDPRAGGHRAEELRELLAALRRDPGFERIALEGLDDARDAGAGARAGPARRQPARSSGACSEETEGNPFFIEETLRSLAEARRGGPLERALSRVPCPRASRS